MGAPQISVAGAGGRVTPELARLATEVGRLLAERGAVLVCGGLGGVMEAAARGAREAGGATIGILPGESPAAASPWIQHVVATGSGHARNLAVAASGDALIAVGGGWGTASEIALARKLCRPVVVLGGGPAVEGEGIERVESAAEAVELALARAAASHPA
ncbi:MAG: TIGR00725 family protein [Thermoleophilia bacterium]|nr:TIGR00725 family protein [Thermoleophilia bacterium]